MGNPKNPSVLAAMAGITDGNFAQNCLINGGAGMVTIGGYPVGKEMILASTQVAQRGRKEFSLNNGKESREILREAEKVVLSPKLIINLRFNNSNDTKNFITNFNDLLTEKIIIEINAHCRQPEVMEKGGGQGLVRRIEVLTDIVEILQSKDFKVSLKIRGSAVNSDLLIPYINKWQLDFLHIDSYHPGKEGTDLDLLGHYFTLIDTSIIGNNSVIDSESAQAILATGVPFFSVARAARKNPFIFEDLLKHF
ncbi:MAG: hypothetical protein ACXAC8_10545 [Candidatus Hodarchaeales archaeon]|jgi:TIM-barrel protein